MANWIPFTFGRVALEPLELIASHILTVVDLLGNLLVILGTIIEIIAVLIMGFFNALAQAINALLEAIGNFLNDLLSMGFYFLWYAPGLAEGSGSTRQFSEWLRDVADTFDNDQDNYRPQFSRDAYVGGLVLCVAYPTFDELIEMVGKFLKLWTDGWDFLKDLPSGVPSWDDWDPPPRTKGAWRSASFRDVEVMRVALMKAIHALDKFKLFEDANSVIQNFAEMLKRKGQQIQRFAREFKDLVVALIHAISETGVWALPIYGRGGNPLLQSALTNITGVPNDIVSSAEDGALKAAAYLRQTMDDMQGLDLDQSFVRPDNRVEPMDTTINMIEHANAHVDRLDKDVQSNPNGMIAATANQGSGDPWNIPGYSVPSTVNVGDSAYRDTTWPVPPADDVTRDAAAVTSLKVVDDYEALVSYLKSLSADPAVWPRPPKDNSYQESPMIGAGEEFDVSAAYRSDASWVNPAGGITTIGLGRIDFIGHYGMVTVDGEEVPADVGALAEHDNMIDSSLADVTGQWKLGCMVILDLSACGEFNIGSHLHTAIVDLVTSESTCHTPSKFILVGNDNTANLVREIESELHVIRSIAGVTEADVPGGDPSTEPGAQAADGTNSEGNAPVQPMNENRLTRDEMADPVNAGAALGQEISDAMGADGVARVPVPVITYDDDGNMQVRYEERELGPRFMGTEYPDFAGLDNVTFGCMIVTGGPSDAPVQALFNLLGVTAVAGETVAAGAMQVAEQARATDAIFGDFAENYEYTQAQNRTNGDTLNWP